METIFPLNAALRKNSFQPIRILYIEDDIILALMIQEQLDQYGYIVDLAKDGYEGLNKLQEGTYDVVAVDYHLPDINGLQVLQHLMESGLKVPAIMVTGEGNEQIAVAVMKLGASDYLVKDTQGNYFKLLPSVIERVLEKQRGLEEKARYERALYERDTILEAVSFAAEQFLTATHWFEPLPAVLARLGQSVAASRVYLCENHFADEPAHSFFTTLSLSSSESENLLMSRRYEWVATYITSPPDNLDWQGRPYYPRFSRWVDYLSHGQALCGLVKDFPAMEANILAKEAIRSIAILPIFVGKQWWGFIGYEDCLLEREWLPIVIEACRAAANILGAAIQHEQIDQALRDSEARLVRTQRIAHLGHCEWDLLTNTRYLSAETCRILGLPPQNKPVPNAVFTQAIHPADRQRVQQAVEQTLHHNWPYDIEFRIVRPDGTHREIHALAELIRNKQGKPIRFVGTAQDITERKQVERAWRESTQTLSAILNAATDSIVMTELDTTCVIINPAGAARLGVEDEIIGQPLCHFVAPEVAQRRQHFFAQVVQSKQAVRFEDEERPQIWFEHSMYPVLDENDTVRRIAIVSRDVTGRKQTEQALLESERTLRAILNATPDNIFMIDLEGIFITLNPTAAKKFQKEINELMGQSLYQYLPPVVAEKRKSTIQQIIQTKQSVALVEESDADMWCEINYCPVINEQNAVSRIAIFARDITQRKRADDALRASQKKYASLFNTAEVSLWEEDFSAVLARFNQLRAAGITDLRSYLAANPASLWDFLQLIKINNVNAATLRLFEANSLSELRQAIDQTFVAASEATFIEELCAIWSGKKLFQVETRYRTLKGKNLAALLSMPIPETEEEFAHLPVSILDITELKQIEEALRKERDFTNAIINIAGSLVVVLDRQGQIVRFNRTCEELTGYSFEEVKGRSVWELFIRKDEIEEIKNYFHSLVTARPPYRNENYWVTKKNTLRLIDWFNTVLTDDKGEVEYVIATGIDITERKRTEKALARTLAEQKVILDNSPVGIAFLGEGQRFVRVNRKLEEIFGYTELELQNQTARLLYASNGENEELGTEVFPRLTKDDTYETEQLMRRQDGSWFWCRFLIKAVDPEDLSKGYIWNLEDVTNQKQAEENLRLAAKVFETTTEGILVTDTNTRVIMVNPAFTTITGYTLAEVVSKKPSFLHSGRHPLEFYKRMWRTLLKDGKWQGEIWNRRKNGEFYVEWAAIAAIRDTHQQIVQYVSVFSDITERKRSEEMIWHQANYDALTNLPNRTLFVDCLARALLVAKRQQLKIAVMFIDLDRFKWVNDTLGHEAGDQLLQETAQRLRTCIRDSDTIARLGGDEFTAFLTQIEDILAIKIIAERILDNLSRAYLIDNHEVFVSGSIGITLFPEDGQEVATLLKNADTAMYQAKESGRNAYRFFTPTMNAQITERVQLEQALHQALDNNEFFLHYQPLFDLASEQIIGVEALLRWQRSHQDNIFPKQFLPIAEETGLINPIGQWTLMTALKQLQTWYTAELAPLQMAINFSTRQLKNSSLVEMIVEILENIGLPASVLIVEMTESTLLENALTISPILQQLHDLGVTIAIDDFGEGCASLNYLKQFPIDILKLDQNFIHNLAIESYNKILIEAIIALAHKLNIKVVGEVVETEEQLTFLRTHHCDWVQGKYFSNPLLPQEFEQFVKQRKYFLSTPNINRIK
ncbi:diguanylate cyclase/phosphodiesterase [Thioploca ingrica]|uniref:Diguanylate cyclase/phosphodiesterase n=1 Tax=Thioploca ingrica TaxID=40754 RepID=A0A090AQU0_9GAMM|nr:diguanylate cyclase/phosphodiesterase [Thioploca ingrica]